MQFTTPYNIQHLKKVYANALENGLAVSVSLKTFKSEINFKLELNDGKVVFSYRDSAKYKIGNADAGVDFTLEERDLIIRAAILENILSRFSSIEDVFGGEIYSGDGTQIIVQNTEEMALAIARQLRDNPSDYAKIIDVDFKGSEKTYPRVIDFSTPKEAIVYSVNEARETLEQRLYETLESIEQLSKILPAE